MPTRALSTTSYSRRGAVGACSTIRCCSVSSRSLHQGLVIHSSASVGRLSTQPLLRRCSNRQNIVASAWGERALDSALGLLLLGCTRVGFWHVCSMLRLARYMADRHANADLSNISILLLAEMLIIDLPMSLQRHYYWTPDRHRTS